MIWTVCSGCGGVGKSMIALSLAAGASKAGRKAVLLDLSGISRSCDLNLKIESIVALDMLDVMRDQVPLEAALYRVSQYPNLQYACASLYDDVSVSELSGIVLALHSMCDVLVMDMPTGQIDLPFGVMRAGDERLLVTRPDDASVRSTERLMMRCTDSGVSDRLIINRISPERIRKKTQYAQPVVENLLDRAADACIPEDACIPACESQAKAAIECGGPVGGMLCHLVDAMLDGIG